MSCKLIYNVNNEITGMQAPSGASSTLYPALLERTKDVQNAVELTTMTHTGGFIDQVVQPLLSKYTSEVNRRLKDLKPKNTSLQLVHNGKEYTVDIENLQYKVVLTKGFETVQAYAQVGEEKVMLGKVRLKSYKEGLAIESTNLSAVSVYVNGNLESLQGKGIGTEIYKKAINHTLKQGKPFYSDANQTQAAAGVWEKLKSTKLVVKEDGRNKIEAYPSSYFDKNQEVLPKIVINYILTKQAQGKQLTFAQKQDVRNALLFSDFENSLQMSEALNKVFFKDGEFVVEESRMKAHYNSYEIASILTNKELQKGIKNTLEALKNTEEVLVSDVYFTDEFVSKSSELNSLGKMTVNNPLLTQQQVIQELGGIKDEKEFADKIENLELNLTIGSTSTEVEVASIFSLPIAESYKKRATQVKEQSPTQYWSFDIPSDAQIEEAAVNGRLVDTVGGMGIVTADGNMIGMFKYDNTQKGTAEAVQAARIAKGGLKLDNFDGYLTKLYEKNGFRVVSRIPFNEEYASDLKGWDRKLHGTPDVVAMVYDPSNKLNIEEKTFSSYERAMEYRDSFLEKSVEGNALFNSSLEEASRIAEAYMKENGIAVRLVEKILKLDEAQSKRISDAYIAMEITPNDPTTIAAYTAMAEETIKQYEFITKSGYKLEINNNEPYSSAKGMIDDLKANKRMKIFSTESGFGEDPITKEQRNENMLLKDSGFKDVNGETLLVNDIFRFVHDFFGHAKLGNGFGAVGEENAWNVHMKMYSPLAVRAMTTETRGQNSYVNFSGVNEEAFKLRDKARVLRKEGKIEEAAKLTEQVYDIMKFAEQKVGLLPEWASQDVESKPLSGGAAFSKFFAKITNIKDGGAKFADAKEVLNKSIEGYEDELAAYLKYGKNFQKHIMASIPAFVDARIRVLKGMVEASKILGKGGKEVNMLDITSSEGYFTKAYAQLAQDKGVNAKADALDAGVTFQRDFNESPQVPGVNYLLQAWGESFIDPDSGVTIPVFKPTKKYGVVFEGMGFQFFTPTREKEIAEVKGMMEPDGMLVTMQKFKNADYEKREVLKDEFKAKFFTKEEMAQKAATVLKKSDEASVGMMDYQFDRQEYEKVLAKNFKYVAQFYSAGNFAGYIATDSLEVMNASLNATGDTTTKFNEEVTPKIIQGEEIEYSNNEVKFSVNEVVDPKDVIYHGMMVTNPQALEEAFPAVHPNKLYHHSTVAFKPQDTSNIEVGKAQELKVIGRITTDKVDALLVENLKSTNKDAHITLSTAEGVKPFEVNKEIENNREKITTVPEGTTVQTTEGYFDGKQDVTSVKDKGPFSAVIEKLKQTGLAENIYSLTNQEIEAKLTELGVGISVNKQLASGIKVTAAGFTYKGDVYLNTDTMTLDTPIHEMGHLYLNMLRAGGKDTYEVLVKGMNLAKSKEAEAYRNHVKKYQPKLKEGTPEFYEEVLAQAIGDAGAKFLEGSSKDGFLDWLEEMWDSFKDVMGLSQYMKDKGFKNITFGQFTQAIARDLFDHQTIEGIKASIPNTSEGAFLKVKDGPKYKDTTGIDLKGYKADFIDTTVPVKTLDEVVREYEGRLFFITSDFTGVGMDSEGDSIEGGVGYLAIKKNVDDKIGFASLDDTTGKSVLTRVKNIYGENKKVAIVIMAQTPSSTLGNYYGAKYFGRGLRTLKSTLTPAEYQGAITSLDNILQNNEAIQKAIKNFENSKKGYPLRGPLLQLLHNVENYSSKEFAQEFIKDTTFEIRRELMKTIFLKGSDVAMDKSTHGIKRNLEEVGFNTYNFLKEYGDNTTLTEQMIKDDKGGLLLGGFEMLTTADAKKEVKSTKGRGIQHPQFNGKVPSNGNHFILDGAYELENNFTSASEVESQLNPEYLPEIQKEFNKFAKKINTNAKEYKDLSSAHKIKFKGELNKKNPNFLLINVPSVQASVSRGLGVKLSEQGQKDLIEKATPKFSIAEEGWESQRGTRGVDGETREVAQKQEPVPTLKKKVVNKSLFQKMQEFKRMPEMKIEFEELKQVDNNDTKTVLEQTFTVGNGYELSKDIVYLNTLSQDLYDENPAEVEGLLQEIEKKAARQGVDIIGISEKVFSKTRDEIYDLLEDLNNLIAEPSQTNLYEFAESYDAFFEVQPEASEKVLKVGENNLKKTLIYLDTKVSEYQLFDRYSLVKVAENVYQKVEKPTSLYDLYDKLYQIAQYNERVLPIEAFPLANERGVLNLSTIRKSENKEVLVKDIQSFIENKITALDLSSPMMENEELQQMVAFKYFFNNPMVFKSDANLQQEDSNFNNFDGSEAYLKTDFISDFYSDFLKEKIKDSDLFQNFYSYFVVKDKGIALKEDDAITLIKIKDYLDSGSVRGAKDLKNYSLLSNQMPNLKGEEVKSIDYTRESKRAFYTNFPRALDRLNQNYSRLSDSTISVKGSAEEFVRVNSGVYELIEQNNGVGYYGQLDKNLSDYKAFKIEEPTLSINIFEYGPEGVYVAQNAVEVEKYYTKQEESKIDDENFACL